MNDREQITHLLNVVEEQNKYISSLQEKIAMYENTIEDIWECIWGIKRDVESVYEIIKIKRDVEGVYEIIKIKRDVEGVGGD